MSSRELVPVPPPLPPPAPKRGYRVFGLLLVGLGLVASGIYLYAHRSAAPPPALKVAVSGPQPAAPPELAPLPVPRPVAQLELPPPAKEADREIPVLAPPPSKDASQPPAEGPVPAPGWKLKPGEAESLTTGSIGHRTVATYANRDIDGFDYRTVKDTSLAECRRTCQADGNCRAFTFNTWRHVCFLKASATVQRIEPRGVSGVKGEDIRTALRPPTIERLPLRQFPGAPYRFVRSSDFDGCARQCLAEPACLGFNFDTAARSCGLIASLDRPTRDDSTVAGMKWQPPLVEISAKRRRGPPLRRDLPPDATVIFDAFFGQILR